MSLCDWPVDRSCLPALPAEDSEDYETELAKRNAAEDLAVSVMWALSGRQFGVCPRTVRPCLTGQDNRAPWVLGGIGYGYGGYAVNWWSGNDWVNLPCGCSGRCTLTGPRAVHLPGAVYDVVEVVLGEEVLDPDEWVLQGEVLYRIGSVWPSQDLGRPMGEANTWSVQYLEGIPVPGHVARLTGILAREFLYACDGSAKCRLPRTVVSTTRSGITHIFDPTRMYSAGKTGVPDIDLWLQSVNPHKVLSAPQVL